MRNITEKRHKTRHSRSWPMQTVTVPFTGRIEKRIVASADPKKHLDGPILEIAQIVLALAEPRKAKNRERPERVDRFYSILT